MQANELPEGVEPNDLPMDMQPGTTGAQAAGCICQPRDDEAGFVDRRWPHWLTLGCPIHGH